MTRKKHIWQSRREKRGGEKERMRGTEKGEQIKSMRMMQADGRREERGGGNREEWGVIMSTSLMLEMYSVRIFQTRFLT